MKPGSRKSQIRTLPSLCPIGDHMIKLLNCTQLFFWVLLQNCILHLTEYSRGVFVLSALNGDELEIAAPQRSVVLHTRGKKKKTKLIPSWCVANVQRLTVTPGGHLLCCLCVPCSQRFFPIGSLQHKCSIGIECWNGNMAIYHFFQWLHKLMQKKNPGFVSAHSDWLRPDVSLRVQNHSDWPKRSWVTLFRHIRWVSNKWVDHHLGLWSLGPWMYYSNWILDWQYGSRQ